MFYSWIFALLICMHCLVQSSSCHALLLQVIFRSSGWAGIQSLIYPASNPNQIPNDWVRFILIPLQQWKKPELFVLNGVLYYPIINKHKQTLINHSKDTHPVWCNVTCGFFSRGFELVLAFSTTGSHSPVRRFATGAPETAWLMWKCHCGSTDNHPSLNLPRRDCRSYSSFAEQTGRLIQSARSFWVFSREWCVPPGYACPEDLIDSRNLSRDTRFCRCTVQYSNLQVVLLNCFFCPYMGVS